MQSICIGTSSSSLVFEKTAFQVSKKLYCCLARYFLEKMADLDESAQDSLLDAALHTSKDDDAVLGDISGVDPTVDDSLEDPVTLKFA